MFPMYLNVIFTQKYIFQIFCVIFCQREKHTGCLHAGDTLKCLTNNLNKIISLCCLFWKLIMFQTSFRVQGQSECVSGLKLGRPYTMYNENKQKFVQ